MSPVAPMPQGAPVGTNGLNVWVMVDSGELSMTSVLPVVAAPVFVFVPPELVLLDEHAASPAASRPAAPTAKSRLGLFNLLITLVFLSYSAVGFVIRLCVQLQAAAGRVPGRLRPGASKP